MPQGFVAIGIAASTGHTRGTFINPINSYYAVTNGRSEAFFSGASSRNIVNTTLPSSCVFGIYIIMRPEHRIVRFFLDGISFIRLHPAKIFSVFSFTLIMFSCRSSVLQLSHISLLSVLQGVPAQKQ